MTAICAWDFDVFVFEKERGFCLCCAAVSRGRPLELGFPYLAVYEESLCWDLSSHFLLSSFGMKEGLGGRVLDAKGRI